MSIVMSKVTFRADDDLVTAVERLDASKSEVMRKALRAYLAGRDEPAADDGADRGSLDAVVADRVDDLVADALDDRRVDSATRADEGSGRDVNVNITVESPAATSVDAERSSAAEGAPVASGDSRRSDRQRPRSSAESCNQCGTELSGDHVYCPNCGEKATHRVFCECGDEVRADWSFCPHCGRRTASADALDQQG